MIGVYVLGLVVIGCNVVFADDFYTNKYDNVNVNHILKSERLLQRYIFCLLDKGPCTSDGRFFKEILPEALATNCSKCSMKQKEIVKTVTLHLMNEKPDEWLKFVEKYDPDVLTPLCGATRFTCNFGVKMTPYAEEGLIINTRTTNRSK